MLRRPVKLTAFLHIILLALFLSWLVLLIVTPIAIHPDSGGYQLDADHIVQTGYVTMRPPLFPLFLSLADVLHIKMSILAFFVNIASLLYLLWLSSGKEKLFSAKNTIILIGFLMLPAIWSLSGAKLSESIMFAAETWIFIFLVQIFFPSEKIPLLRMVFYSIGIGLLSIWLKPWLMGFMIVSTCFLLAAGILFRSFRSARVPALVLMGVLLLTATVSFKYNMGKSPTTGNMVLLMCGSLKDNDLAERLQAAKDSESAIVIRDVMDDIHLINGKYHSNPFEAPPAQLKLLNFTNPDYQAPIKKAFILLYLKRGKDIWGLVELAFSHYFKEIFLGWTCLQTSGGFYGPCLPGFEQIGLYGLLLLLAAAVIYGINWRNQHPDKVVDAKLTIFSLCIFGAGVLFALFLCVAGGFELGRTVLPAILFQLLALVYFIQRFPATATGKKLS